MATAEMSDRGGVWWAESPSEKSEWERALKSQEGMLAREGGGKARDPPGIIMENARAKTTVVHG